MQPQKQIITSWNLHEVANMSVLFPENKDDLVECLDFAKKNSLKISIKGGGNSFSDVGMNEGQLLIDLKNFHQFE